MKQQQRMKVMKDMIRKIRTKEAWMRTAVGGSVSCWPLTARKLGAMQDVKIPCRTGTTGCAR